MRLDQSLVARGLSESRTEAQELIDGGVVILNGEVCEKQTRKVLGTDTIEVTQRRRFVSRGGEKLLGILHDVIGDDNAISACISGQIALDVGSSTGGFTDCLLSFGAKHIDAVDVGTSQLHTRIRDNGKVSAYESTDIRKFSTETKYDIIVCDVSFISLLSIFGNLVNFGKEGTLYFLLIKPQFEVGKGNTKKGIVKDNELVTNVLTSYRDVAERYSLRNVQVLPSHVIGGDGNQEYFLCANQ
jgi:23S rRNA (cytidine1920-2'-O)/16S rRNA (cytidine1409-2'-O)-methyltransferase